MSRVSRGQSRDRVEQGVRAGARERGGQGVRGGSGHWAAVFLEMTLRCPVKAALSA